jgi:hypothetical protein
MKKQKHLSDSEMMSWNDRLDGTPYFVIPRYHSHNSFPMIVFKQRMTKGLGSFKTDPTGEVITLDPHMKFSFSFSVAKNRVDNFFHIFNKWFSNKIETKTIYQDSSNNEKISDINITDDIIKSKKELDHSIKEKEYTKFTYEFEGKLSSIMAYVMFLEDTIEIFSKIWGYDEDGSEHTLTKFAIGDIVTKTGDQSEDYLVLDFSPTKSDNKFNINYEICKMITKGQIIQYGQVEFVNESDISWSRNNRIDDILN